VRGLGGDDHVEESGEGDRRGDSDKGEDGVGDGGGDRSGGGVDGGDGCDCSVLMPWLRT
jgi:hypothetical protein